VFFLEIKHFTDVGNYICERRRTSLLYFVKIHHNILNIFYEITLLLSDVIKNQIEELFKIGIYHRFVCIPSYFQHIFRTDIGDNRLNIQLINNARI
jgi:hypothetical protein